MSEDMIFELEFLGLDCADWALKRIEELEAELAEVRGRVEKAEASQKIALLRISQALEEAESGTIDGDWHKMWVIDQMVRKLTGPKYKQWVKDFENGEEGPETYAWDVGIAP